MPVYKVAVFVRDPHDPQARMDSGGSYVETVHAPTSQEAARIARQRHVGGRVEMRHIHAKIVSAR